MIVLVVALSGFGNGLASDLSGPPRGQRDGAPCAVAARGRLSGQRLHRLTRAQRALSKHTVSMLRSGFWETTMADSWETTKQTAMVLRKRGPICVDLGLADESFPTHVEAETCSQLLKENLLYVQQTVLVAWRHGHMISYVCMHACMDVRIWCMVRHNALHS